MKVLFIHDHIFKEYDGAIYSSGGLPSSVWSRYLDVFDELTVVGRNGGKLASKEMGYTLSSARGVTFNLLPNISDVKSILFGNQRVKRVCRELVSRHDGIIARLPSRLGQLFVTESIRQGKPYAVEVVACSWDAFWNYGRWEGKVFAPFSTIKLKFTVGRAPFALYVTESFLQGRYPCKGGHVTFCSNVEISPVSEDVLQWRLEKIKKRADKITFGLIGNYSSRYKGIDVAIRALALVKDELPDWGLEVLGSGDSQFYSDLAREHGVAKRVKFVGSLPSGQPVYDWLDNVDIYLQPSFQEGLPRALVEAMSRGCPALASSIAGIPELLSPRYMVAAGDYVSLSKKLVELAVDDANQLQVSKQNFETAGRYYKPLLDERRTAFWLAFRSYIESK